MIMGKIILLEAKSGRDRTTEALSYGHASEPSPDLLLRRGRATLFSSGDEAEAALLATFQAEDRQGNKWPSKFMFKIVTVENHE